MKTKPQRVARNHYLIILHFIRSSNGSVHPSVWESAIGYGKMSGLTEERIRLDLREANVPAEDIDGFPDWQESEILNF